MTKQNTNRILLIYNILLCTAIVIAGISLIAGCLSIYYSGNGYSRELVAQTFSKICVPVYICLGLVVGSFIINAIIPSSNKEKPAKHYNQMLLNLKKTHNVDLNSEYTKIEKKKRFIVYIHLAIIFACGILFLIYALDSNHFHQSDINSSMINAMWRLIPCLVIPFAFAVFKYYYNLFLTKKQIEILKALPKNETATETTKNKSNDKKILITKIVIATVAVGVLIFGAVTGGFSDVLTKAVNICTECIGLG